MTNSTALVTTNQNEVEDNYFDAFCDIGQIDQFELKKDQMGAQMGALMAFSGKTRSELMESLGWKKSRVSNVLSGRCNLTIKTVWDFASALDFDFDVVFHAKGNSPQIQPWQIAQSEVAWIPYHPVIEIQTVQQVVYDMLNGNSKEFYISLQVPDFSVPIGLTNQDWRRPELQMNTALISTAIPLAINR